VLNRSTSDLCSRLRRTRIGRAESELLRVLIQSAKCSSVRASTSTVTLTQVHHQTRGCQPIAGPRPPSACRSHGGPGYLVVEKPSTLRGVRAAQDRAKPSTLRAAKLNMLRAAPRRASCGRLRHGAQQAERGGGRGEAVTGAEGTAGRQRRVQSQRCGAVLVLERTRTLHQLSKGHIARSKQLFCARARNMWLFRNRKARWDFFLHRSDYPFKLMCFKNQDSCALKLVQD
jgi:hypothetical protein